ncbi:MAG: ThuA domain-containing protein [Gemmataceae bacterium]|nr:ThuA domain-containing protein [Gemmataceae bacterium]
MRRGRLPVALALGLLLAAAVPWTSAVEGWADPNLPVTDGLEVWLDAARQNAARRALKKPEVVSGAPLDVCYDASGKGRHLLQKDPAARPVFQAAAGYTALRFAGERQHLARTGLDRSYRDVTVFLVAAPFANPGSFRGFLALNQAGKNDYTSGLTIDQGPGVTARFQSLNVEGAGFVGAANLLQDGSEFGTVQRLCITSTPGAGGTRLYVNGKPAGQRDRRDSTLRMDQLTVGARFYTNGGPPQVRGFLEGDVLELLIYDRVLSKAERERVETYLAARHGDRRKVAIPQRPTVGKPLVRVTNPPPVQVLVPGFTVRQLPVELTNINNVQYRPDGKLVALAYDGNVYLLSDSDGDGLEDRVERFWENKGRLHAPVGMALTPPGYKHGNGLFVASKGKCSLIVDSRGGDKADKEIVIAEGWEPGEQHGVDALGVAFDPRDGSVYFGLGTGSYTNAYRLDKGGKSNYRLGSERGTILRVAPDFKSRTIICTGIRFPVGLRFNRLGDLFCTDQEGATWLPNGNPFDELLHVQKGRHYGFPPRHPRHLPKVVDEPSVFDYRPQHQSACGLTFNEPVGGGEDPRPVVGPAWWRSDAFVTGYSRGKLYRTQLVKTAAGYVAQNQLLATLNMLAVEACVSPTGDLVLAVHGGGPDWGSGPGGKGKLYKLSYTGKGLAQPVLAWAQGPREVRVAFDRPLPPEQVRDLLGKVVIEYGKYVAAGDRFELHRPGYEVVRDQLRAPRFDLPVVGVQVTADRRTLILATEPHPQAVGYALTLPGLGRNAPGSPRPSGGEGVGVRGRPLPQAPETDLGYSLCGVEAAWLALKGDDSWTGWLPHLDLGVARKLTVASAPHDELWGCVKKPGKLTLRTKLNLVEMLRPAVQPGSKVDHAWPPEEVTVELTSSIAVEVRGSGSIVSRIEKQPRRHVTTVSVRPGPGSLTPLEIRIPTGDNAPELLVTYYTAEDPRRRALPLHRFLLPWAALKKDSTLLATPRDIPELRGGNWERGRGVFFSDLGTCSRCHRVGGQGGLIGPDLSNLPQRDYASVMRDIAEPSFAIHPDYITHILTLKDGRVLTGNVRAEKDLLHLGDEQGKTTTVRRDEIDRMATVPISLMPGELPRQIGPEKMKDLLTFLLTEPPRMPDYGKGQPPPPRALQEVTAILAGAPDPPARTRPLHVVLVAGKQDHGPGEHDYPAWLSVWQRLLSMADGVKVTTAMEWPSAAEFKTADVMAFYQRGKWTPERARDVEKYLARGGGLVYIHWAVDGGNDAPGFAQRIGLAWRSGASKFRHGALELGFEGGGRHPIARNFTKVTLHDESYWDLVGDPKKINLLATGVEGGQARPLFWTLEPARGRVFVSIPGHFAWTFDDPLYRTLLLRGIAWAARESVDRFNHLVTPGVRIRP